MDKARGCTVTDFVIVGCLLPVDLSVSLYHLCM